MKSFTSTDIENYYDQTEVHYRMFWKLEKVMGLHYGIWDDNTKNIEDAILNTNRMLADMGSIHPADRVLDAGCGIGGSSFFLAKKFGCDTVGISLSKKQIASAKKLAASNGLADKCLFFNKDYTNTGFEANSFDVIWAIESLGSAPDKSLFFKEMNRILKPGGRILVADTFKPESYDISNEKIMQVMLNGWAISDIHSIEEMKTLAGNQGFETSDLKNVSKEIKRSVDMMYRAAWLGMIGTKVYNFFRKASYFSRIHYTTGLAQKKAYKKGLWGYYLFVFKKTELS